MKLAIVGNGAIGNLVAASCRDQKIDFTLLTRTGQGFGLSITHFDKRKQKFKPEVRHIEHPEDFDILVLPLKAYQISLTLKQLMPNIRPQHVIVLLHNGMGTIEEVRSLLPYNPIIAATSTYGAYKPDQNTLIETGLGQTQAGWVSQSKSANAAQVESILTSLLRPCTWHDDVQLALWRKLAVNAIINPLTAINQINNGQLSELKYQQSIKQLCQETAQIMQTCGYSSSPAELFENVSQIIQKTAANFSSMNRDIAHKRPTEIDFINGYIIAQGHKFDLEVPYNTQMFDAIKQLEGKYIN